MKKVAPGIYVEGEADPYAQPSADERHEEGGTLKEQFNKLRKEEHRSIKTLQGSKAVDTEDHPATDYKEVKGGTIVPSLLEKKTVRDSHGEVTCHVSNNGGGIPGVDDPKKAHYGTRGVTKRNMAEDMSVESVEENFYP